MFGAGGYLAKRWGPSYQPRGGQVALSRAVDAAIRTRTHLLSEAPTGCHAAGQLVMMYDWSTKKVEDVVVGDRLMGRDRASRTVLGLARGEDFMVDIVPHAELPVWEPWRVNRGHILTVFDATQLGAPDALVDVPLLEWKRWHPSRRIKSRLLRFHGGVAILAPFSAVATGTVEPYFGFTLDGDGRFLLGDGTVTHNTGKSLAYSVPASYHAATGGKTVVIVTANISLQEQLDQEGPPAPRGGRPLVVLVRAHEGARELPVPGAVRAAPARRPAAGDVRRRGALRPRTSGTGSGSRSGRRARSRAGGTATTRRSGGSRRTSSGATSPWPPRSAAVSGARSWARAARWPRSARRAGARSSSRTTASSSSTS